ncbi:MAG TPA: permease-like cell division protein FtsX [Bacillota bacterium]|nr:permease-like cell division protein FtsX [Bacillota bacterium]
MKIRTLIRHINEGFKNISRNGWMSFASIGAVTVTLILVGAFLALILNLNQIAHNIESDVEVKAFIERTADENDVRNLGTEIESIAGVKSVSFASNDEELESLIESMGEEGEAWRLFKQDNPLTHAFIIKPEVPKDTTSIAEQVTHLDHVREVTYGKDTIDRLFTFNDYARNIGLVLIIGLVLTAIFLISNTIKLTIMARSEEIGIMKLVGATNGFIRWPFFIEGMLLGALGSVVPILLILVGYNYLDGNIREKVSFSFVEFLPFYPFAIQLSLIILLIGVFIGMWGSVMSVRKFLRV